MTNHKKKIRKSH